MDQTKSLTIRIHLNKPAQTIMFLTVLTVSITIIIVFMVLIILKTNRENSEEMELLVDDTEYFTENSSKFNLTLPRKVSSFCLNFRQILEQENYFALNI